MPLSRMFVDITLPSSPTCWVTGPGGLSPTSCSSLSRKWKVTFPQWSGGQQSSWASPWRRSRWRGWLTICPSRTWRATKLSTRRSFCRVLRGKSEQGFILSHELWIVIFSERPETENKGRFMRKGETGDWRTKLSDEQVKIIHLVYLDYSNGFEIDDEYFFSN